MLTNQLNSESKNINKIGSIEEQVVSLTQRVKFISNHLKINKKDYSSQRGLRKILGKRKRLLTYLYKKDFLKYKFVIQSLGIRSLK
uniref:Small ribosomal subunit protein uS15c n=1 Tax=Chaetosphaeridium globosum TaxID=96477 RepID=RR15_CHAGL|nr:ribosomal protein S15 [Chaetosphaeridium globosum]Q8M9T4.1 RecName: Full=Small ribosomal subunit protein uS15c; AltName: Full=30S ribosomal protein S15, chloroplastic [Chaetosphaeridium globosum]AAM96571.1 ribosomal protein S15 [Chaetosphaeridium globosum]